MNILLEPLSYWDQHSFEQEVFWEQNSFGPIFLLDKDLLGSNFLCPNIIRNPFGEKNQFKQF